MDWFVTRFGSKMKAFGGRGLTNAIEGEVLTPLAREILFHEYRQDKCCRFVVGLGTGVGVGVGVEVKVD